MFLCSCKNKENLKEDIALKHYPYIDTIAGQFKINNSLNGDSILKGVHFEYYIKHINVDSTVFIGSKPFSNGSETWRIISIDKGFLINK